MAKNNETKHEAAQPFSCTDCGVLNCETRRSMYPQDCLTAALDPELDAAVGELYREEENRKISVVSAEIESAFYGRYTRVEEIMEFARRMGYRRIGIAVCAGLIEEGRIFARILRRHGFEAVGVVCKVGSKNKADLGVPKKYRTTGEVMCNPILQAKLLAGEKTDLNVVVGLCVGHDSLFYKYSEAVTTTLVTKDRVLAHNPAAALYQAGSYYRRLMEREPQENAPQESVPRKSEPRENEPQTAAARQKEGPQRAAAVRREGK
ncbi:MAG: DUF1847 domain-containing protein [Anaerovoracaceae bacterium]|jgi:uncharacterized metal-binding protein